MIVNSTLLNYMIYLFQARHTHLEAGMTSLRINLAK
jgi:hypothetical protein